MNSNHALQIGVAVVLCGFCSLSFADEVSNAGTTPGVWQKHEYRLQYFGFTSTYSCDGLADKLKVLLLAAGARADAKSTSDGCSRGYGTPDKFASAKLTFYTLAPVGNGESESPSVGGAWRSVAIRNGSPREVARGDCELIEQFRNKVLPMFTTRNVGGQVTCVPNQVSGSVNLTFEVFAGIPAKKK